MVRFHLRACASHRKAEAMLNKIVAFAAALMLAACQPAEKPPLDGARIGGSFSLQTGGGRTVTDKDFAGKYRIVYFGYTNCPDVCPTDMAILGRAITQFRKADADAPPIALVFITVDPKRDTPGVASKYAKAFLPDAVGLSGSEAATADVKKAFAVFAKAEPGATPGSYLVDHSRTSYLMDPDGKPMAILPSEVSADAVVKDLERWVR
jgi:protein SCO1/2